MLPQILPLFPNNINTFIDLFGGGFNVGVNVNANSYIYNDKMFQVAEMLQYFKNNSINKLLSEIDYYIEKYQLSKENKEGYLQLREYYNKEYKSSIILYTLICYSFNNQIRFNNKNEYNIPFGKRSFNLNLKNNLIDFVNALHDKDIIFLNKDFTEFHFNGLKENDFIYCDPPYLCGTANYNENGGWTNNNEIDLLNILDNLNKKNIKFALSNVLENKGEENLFLKDWISNNNYTVHYLNANYSNCNYHKKDKESKAVEVLITNY